jgi:polyphosphate glucokinase
MKKARLNVLVIDVGGSHVKMLATGQKERRSFISGPGMTPAKMVAGVLKATKDWSYDVVSMGFPGPVSRGRLYAEPHNLGAGWVGFDFTRAFHCPIKIVNDATMQALGSFAGGKMLFLGLGTGLGTTMIVEGFIEPMELGHLPFRKGTYEDYVGNRGLVKYGKKKWRRLVDDVIATLKAALLPDDIVLGGGNVRLLNDLPAGCRAGDNSNAFLGGFLLWKKGKPGEQIEPLRRAPTVRRKRVAAKKTTVGKRRTTR